MKEKIFLGGRLYNQFESQHQKAELFRSMVTNLTHYSECWVLAGENHSILTRHGLVYCVIKYQLKSSCNWLVISQIFTPTLHINQLRFVP